MKWPFVFRRRYERTVAELACAQAREAGALKALQEQLCSNNTENPWLGVCAAVALLQIALANSEAKTEEIDGLPGQRFSVHDKEVILLQSELAAVQSDLAASERKVAELTAELAAERDFCLCGCPPDQHEDYGEEGESCRDEMHECLRVSAAVLCSVSDERERSTRLLNHLNNGEPRMVNLGDRVKDRISGLVGIVIGRAEYLYGCVQVLVAPPDVKDGSPVSGTWLDEDRTIVVDAAAESKPASAEERAGGPSSMDPSPRRM